MVFILNIHQTSNRDYFALIFFPFLLLFGFWFGLGEIFIVNILFAFENFRLYFDHIHLSPNLFPDPSKFVSSIVLKPIK